MAGEQFNQIGLDKRRIFLFVCSEAVEFYLAILETSHTVILPPMVCVKDEVNPSGLRQA